MTNEEVFNILDQAKWIVVQSSEVRHKDTQETGTRYRVEPNSSGAWPWEKLKSELNDENIICSEGYCVSAPEWKVKSIIILD